MWLERLADLTYLCLHHELDIEGEFSTSATQQSKERACFSNSVALGVPGNVWHKETQFFGELVLAAETEADCIAIGGAAGIWDRRESASSAAKLQDQQAGLQLSKASLVAVERA